jgi:hypothetical protein
VQRCQVIDTAYCRGYLVVAVAYAVLLSCLRGWLAPPVPQPGSTWLAEAVRHPVIGLYEQPLGSEQSPAADKTKEYDISLNRLFCYCSLFIVLSW